MDINKEVENMYNSAKNAIRDDLRTQYYNAAQQRNFVFRQYNNKANRYHSMFSGMPAAMQMQYDQQTFLPNMQTLASRAIQQQQQNQQAWDQHMAVIGNLNSQANYYNSMAQKLNNS